MIHPLYNLNRKKYGKQNFVKFPFGLKIQIGIMASKTEQKGRQNCKILEGIFPNRALFSPWPQVRLCHNIEIL